MERTQWQHIQELFDAALERRDEERTQFLDTACDDPTVRAEVVALLQAHETTGAVDRLAAAWGPAGSVEDGGVEPGERIGPYRVLSEIGHGGMGVVYQAERADGQFAQTVALKLLHRLGRGDIRARFLAERQILAGLDHPHIARLLDGGITDDGTPYFAMEYVEGLPLTGYTDLHRLPVEARLRLFRQACAAVQHAHRSLVVHRDLKPSNILVTERDDGAPEVKLLDFGIAKLIGPEPADGLLLTQTGQRWMTPTYAAPEQITGEPITTATDVYALGVVLFELLTGHRPYRVTRALPHEVERMIVEDAPTKPSAAAAWIREETDDEQQAEVSDVPPRADGKRALQRRLRGDLDTIILKALEKDPERRYASAEALSDDIGRHLDGLPVLARPATLGYRAQSFVRRHRIAVAAAALVVLSLVAGLVGTAWQAQRATAQASIAEAERNRARTEAAKAEQALDFLVALFESSDPNVTGGDTVTAREVLDRGTQRLDEIEQPAVRATLLDAVGRVYRNLGLLPDADTLLAEALALRRTLPDASPEPLATSLLHLGQLRYDRGTADAAEPLLREALALRVPESEGWAAAQHALGETLNEQDRYDEAEAALRAALAARRTLHDATHPDVQATQRILFTTLHRRGDFAAAEVLYREAVDHSARTPERVDQSVIDNHLGLGMMLYRFQRNYHEAETVLRNARDLSERYFGPDHPNTAEAEDYIARVLRDVGRYDEAKPFALAAFASNRKSLGDEHTDTLLSKATLASILWLSGEDTAEAERLYREVLAARRRLYGEENLSVIATQLQLAGIVRDQGRFDESEALLQHTLTVSREHYGEGHPNVIRSLQGIGLAWQAEGRDAEAPFRRGLDLRREQYPDGHWLVAYAEVLLAGALTDLGRYDEAEALLLSGLPVLETEIGTQRRETRRAFENAAALYEAQGRADDAERYRRRLDAPPAEAPTPATRRAER